MDTAALERLERIARNLPVMPGTMHLGKVETALGPVYLALGRGTGTTYLPIAWYGVYAFDYGGHKGMGRLAEVSGRLSLKQAQQQLLDDAFWFMQEMEKRHMNDQSYRLSNG